MIRPAREEELDAICAVYEAARAFMRKTGNPNQWPDDYLTPSLFLDDISKGKLYAVERNGRLCGAFYFDICEDPTYAVIENGAWMEDTPYGVIHRVASLETEHGVFREILICCRAKIRHLRIDTHADNRVMQAVLSKNGFVPCGTVYVGDGTPRIAYELL